MALGLCASGRFPLREITNIINIPKSTVYDIKERGVGVSKPRSGCPRKLSSQDMRQIIRYIRTSKQTWRVTLKCLKRVFQLQVHKNTIYNALTNAGYHYRIARRRPYLNKRDQKRRLKFAKEHKDWTIQQWASVLFYDEMSVKLFMERKT